MKPKLKVLDTAQSVSPDDVSAAFSPLRDDFTEGYRIRYAGATAGPAQIA